MSSMEAELLDPSRRGGPVQSLKRCWPSSMRWAVVQMSVVFEEIPAQIVVFLLFPLQPTNKGYPQQGQTHAWGFPFLRLGFKGQAKSTPFWGSPVLRQTQIHGVSFSSTENGFGMRTSEFVNDRSGTVMIPRPFLFSFVLHPVHH